MTPSHDPPRDGGYKYNPLHGGPAGSEATRWIENAANRFLEHGLEGVKRMPHAQASLSATTRRFDFLRPTSTTSAASSISTQFAIRGSASAWTPSVGAGVNYWPAIADRPWEGRWSN